MPGLGSKAGVVANGAGRTGGPFLSHLRSLMGYDEPETLSYAINSICPIGADGAHCCQNDFSTKFLTAFQAASTRPVSEALNL